MTIYSDFDKGWTPHIFKSSDGLNIHTRLYGRRSHFLPLVCLAGLTRNSIDFHALALNFVDKDRYVVALDSRGRGLSDYDADFRHYTLPTELNDSLGVLASLDISKAIFIGTSRGGLMTMLLASLKPEMIAGAILNDIGPVLEVEGLRRIQGYVGQMAVPSNYEEAVRILKFISNGQFSGLSEDEWLYFAKTTWKNIGLHDHCKLQIRYDLNIAKSIQEIDLEKPIPDLWPQFESLRQAPVLSLRGEHSDLFSPATQKEMMRRHPLCEAYIIKCQAHAPLLADEPSFARIEEFIEKVDQYDNKQQE